MISDSCFLVFAKYPEPGRVKTRLAPFLGAERACELYRLFLLDSLDLYRSLRVPLWIFFDPPQSEALFHHLLGPQSPGTTFLAQSSGTLGQRMAKAFATAFHSGISRALLLGTDYPDLPAAYLEDALTSLYTNGAVIGQATDGGFYCIGFSKPSFQAEIFQGIPWSTDAVFNLTSERLRTRVIKTHFMPAWSDVDMPEDLKPFLERTKLLSLRSRDYLLQLIG